MYQINRADCDDVLIYKLENTTTGQYVAVAPEFGATLAGLGLCVGNKLYHVTDNPLTANEFKKNDWFKGAVLFPFPNRICDGKYTFEGKAYTLEINEASRQTAIHGLVYKMPFEVVATNQTESEAEINLQTTYDGHLAGYPFPFTLFLQFKISDADGLTFSIKATNTGQTPMPFGFGWHPYFVVGGGTANQWQMQLPVNNRLEVDNRLLPTGNLSPYTTFGQPTTIGNTELDTGFDLNLPNGIAHSIVTNPNQNLTLTCWQAAGPGGFNNLQVFIPPSRNSVALEPMTCPAQAFNSGNNLMVLQPGATWNSTCGVTISELL